MAVHEYAHLCFANLLFIDAAWFRTGDWRYLLAAPSDVVEDQAKVIINSDHRFSNAASFRIMTTGRFSNAAWFSTTAIPGHDGSRNDDDNEKLLKP